MDNKQFKQLQQQWDQKLKDSGFEDIEDRETGLLTSWTASYSHNANDSKVNRSRGLPHIEAKWDYYRKAEQLLSKRVFNSRRQRAIWKLHSVGKGYKAIGLELGISPSLVQYHVKRLQKYILKKQ